MTNSRKKFSSLIYFFTLTTIRDYIRDFTVNKPLRILVFTNSLILIAGAMLGPIYALFVDIAGGDLMDASIAGSLFALTAGITVLLSGKFTDRIKEQELVVVFGYLLKALGFFLYLFVNSVWMLFAVQAVIGIGDAIYGPAFDALYSKHLDGRKAGRQWSLWESMNYFTSALGAFAGGLIVKNFGFTPLFVLMSGLCLASGLYILKLPRKIL